MRWAIVAWLLLGATFFPGTTVLSAEDGKDPRQAAEEAVWAADRAFAAAGIARDKEGFSSYILPEGSYLAQKIERGREAFVGNWAPLFDPSKQVVGFEWEPLAVAAAESADLAYSIGRAKISFRRLGSDEIVESPGHYLTVWKPDEEGAWKIWGCGTLVIYSDPSIAMASEPRHGIAQALDWKLLNAPDAEADFDWRPEATLTSQSGDLAATLGSYTVEARRGEEKESGGGGYLAVRTKDEKGRWVLVAEGYTPPYTW